MAIAWPGHVCSTRPDTQETTHIANTPVRGHRGVQAQVAQVVREEQLIALPPVCVQHETPPGDLQRCSCNPPNRQAKHVLAQNSGRPAPLATPTSMENPLSSMGS